MIDEPDERLLTLVERLRQDPSLPESLPSLEAGIVRDALRSRTINEIAQRHRVDDAYVWRVLVNAARAAAGQPWRVETAGLGSDTDPGVTGGYGDTGFGSIGNEPPEPRPEEPPDER